MKFLRLFGSTSQRDAVLASIDYKILQKTVGVPGVSILQGQGGGPVPPTPSYSTPFYVENITNEAETLTIAGWDETGYDNYLEIPVEYSTDGTNWSSLGTTGATPLTRTLQPGDKVYLRATTNAWYEQHDGTEEHEWQDAIEHYCVIYGVSKVGGNIMSLLYGINFTGNETTFPSGSSDNFNALFRNIEEGENTELISSSELILPATTLTAGCYSWMFCDCISLTTAPTTLPATTLADKCYQCMFDSCLSLTSVPVLPATTLATECYTTMFQSCTSLTTAPALPATILADNCYDGMFNGCTSLTTAPELPATTLADYCYVMMFGHCTSLTVAPELPATTLTRYCYQQMFDGCTSLNHIKCLATNISASNCTSRWVNGVAATGTFVKDPNMSGWGTGVNDIPSGWTVEDAAA